ncbi:MAG: hypothetical protein IJT87_02735 [Ruminiclostridium sp.]|nr:hypothetical protein [Ruminiclostridium sp.]
MFKRIMKFLPLLIVPAVIMLMQLTCSAAFTTGIDAESSAVSPGDIFKINVKIPVLANADTASIRVEFDSSAFTVLEWHPYLSDGLNETPFGDGYFAAVSANASRAIDLSKGMTLTATMKVNTGARSGNYVFKLVKHDLSYYDETNNSIVELWTAPELEQVSVGIASEDSGLGLVRQAVDRNETFTLNIYVPKCEKADTASIRVEYDESAFELKKWSPEIPGGEVGRGEGFFSLSAANRYRDIDLTNGLTLKAEFKVKSAAASGEHKFTLTKGSMSYYSEDLNDVVELWAPTIKTVSLIVNSPYFSSTAATSKITPSTAVTTSYIQPSYNTGSTSRITANPAESSPKISNTDTTSPLPSDSDDERDPNFTGADPAETSRLSDNTTRRTTVPSEKTGYPYGTNTSSDSIKLEVESTLKELPKSKIVVSTKYRFFPTSTVIRLSNNETATLYADAALRSIGLDDHPSYPMDIGLYNMKTGAPVDLAGADAYIEFLMPIPSALLTTGADIRVYHVEGGEPTRINSSVEYIDGEYKLRFTGTDFSPYVLVDAAHEKMVTPQNTVVKPGSSGSLNPATGVAVAVAVPAAIAGCVFLSKSKHRKRAKRVVDEDDVKKGKKG